jgi:hypothetical protein
VSFPTTAKKCNLSCQFQRQHKDVIFVAISMASKKYDLYYHFQTTAKIFILVANAKDGKKA